MKITFFLVLIALIAGVDIPHASAAETNVTEFRLDYSQAPECEHFATNAFALAQEWYPRLRKILASTNEAPPKKLIQLRFVPMKGVASTSDDVIRVSAEYVTKHTNDFGMIIHELTHVAQDYHGGGEGWVTEGIADYVRHYEFEPKAKMNRINPDKASYRDSYTTAAQFLRWMEMDKNPKIVLELNAASRAKSPLSDVFQNNLHTDVDALWKEFTDHLRASRASASTAPK